MKCDDFTFKMCLSSVQFSRSVMFDSLRPHEWQHARPPCPSPTFSSLRLTSIESVMPSSHLILCCPLLLLPPIPPNIRFSHLENIGSLSSIDLPNIDPFHSILSKPTFAIITTSCIIKVLDIGILSSSHGGKYQLSKF